MKSAIEDSRMQSSAVGTVGRKPKTVIGGWGRKRIWPETLEMASALQKTEVEFDKSVQQIKRNIVPFILGAIELGGLMETLFLSDCYSTSTNRFHLSYLLKNFKDFQKSKKILTFKFHMKFLFCATNYQSINLIQT
jgi:hypothetical protein